MPPHIVAYGSPPPLPAHGIGITLSREPHSYLYVDGSYNAGLAPKVSIVARENEGYLRKDSISVERVIRNWAHLGRRRALRTRINHTCGAGAFVTDEILLLRRGIVYTVSLTAPDSRYKRDKRVLEAIARSFQFTAPL